MGTITFTVRVWVFARTGGSGSDHTGRAVGGRSGGGWRGKTEDSEKKNFRKRICPTKKRGIASSRKRRGDTVAQPVQGREKKNKKKFRF